MATVSAEGEVTITVVAGDSYANEISWSIDDGSSIPQSPYDPSSTNVNTLSLPEGRHTIYYVDSYGDGTKKTVLFCPLFT